MHSGLYAVTRNRCGKHGQLRLTKLSIHSDEAAGLAIRNNYSDSVNSVNWLCIFGTVFDDNNV